MSMKVKKNDKILVLSGKDKGKISKIIAVNPKDLTVIVENVNIVKKHLKPKRQGEKGRVIEIHKPLSISKIKLVCPKCNKATRVGYKYEEKNKFRVCKKCNQKI